MDLKKNCFVSQGNIAVSVNRNFNHNCLQVMDGM